MKAREYLIVGLLVASSMLGVQEVSAFDTTYSTTNTYRFENPINPITHLDLNIAGKVRADSLPVSVEVLMNTSTLIKPWRPAPGVVFKNVNVWVGNGNFVNEINIIQALIGFRVYNSWLESNGIAPDEVQMVEWDGSKWVTLETKLKDKDGIFTYFEAETTNFSPFAITAMKAVTEAEPGFSMIGFEVLVFAAIAALGVLYLFYRKK